MDSSQTMTNSKLRNELQMPWFHGNISRDKTEKLLNGCGDGTFLIRNSTNFPGDFTLCVACKSKVEHYRIYQINEQYTCDKDEFFENLTQLVSHYKRDADGLCHRLVSPIVSEAFRLTCDSPNNEERTKEFSRANLLLNGNDLKVSNESVLGHGEFGDVLLGFYNGKRVAVKTLKNGMSCDLLAEAKFMIGLRHTHLVALIGIVMGTGHDVLMITEYMANGNLVDFLRSRGRHQVERSQLFQFAQNVADGMSYMESRQYVHRDLAARNILLDANLIAKVSDFGLAQVCNQPTAENVRGRFPIKWSAPEALRTSLFTNKSDVWSYGILLWEIYSFGRVPYPRIPIQDVVRHIEKGYRMEPPENCPTFITTLMTECCSLEPERRPSFAEILLRLKRISDLNGSL
ncbi:protein tyrosine kinase domain-containing protein [Ditylenchus destructor]|uniref:Tyrosine-protein kinase n=1 Tax=Ditylenchus destructor TaxID=166010 RepID=A0AAD4R2E9_9BILA|nr:protein tyrosine kinase domain-containing protein [Ditylenchus destructor]